MSMIKNKIANKILKLRKKLNLTQKGLAELIGVNEVDVFDVELGIYNGDLKKMLSKICKNADVNIAYFHCEDISIKPKLKSKIKIIKQKNNSNLTGVQILSNDLFGHWKSETVFNDSKYPKPFNCKE